MTRFGWTLALLVAATGLLIQIATALWPGYGVVLWIHLALGWALLVAAGPALWLHLRRTKSGWRRGLAVVGIVTLCAIPSVGGLDAPHGRELLEHLGVVAADLAAGQRVEPYYVTAPLSLVVLTVLAVLTGIGGVLAPVQGRRSARWSGACLTLLLGWAIGTAAAQEIVGRDSLFLAISAHSVTGGAAVVALLLHVLSSRLWKREAPTRRARTVLALGLLTLGGAMLGLHRFENVRAHRDKADAADVALASTPATADERASAIRGERATLPLDHLRDSLSCGEASCHPDVTHEWRGSAHRFAASNRFYRAAVDDLVERRSLEDAVLCANCHDPDRVLSGRVHEYADGVPSDGSDGVSCLACHGMVDGEVGGGAFTVAAGAPAYRGLLGQDALARDPRRHDQVLGVGDFVLGEGPCRACHKVELGPDHGLASTITLQDTLLDGPPPSDDVAFCERCHLGVARRSFDRYRHDMAGINADLAHYVDHLQPEDRAAIDDVAERALQMAGAVPWINILSDDWPPAAPPAPSDLRVGDPTLRALDLSLESAIEDEQLRLDFTLTNQRIGHAFPAGPLDLNEVWLEVLVMDLNWSGLYYRGNILRGRVDMPVATLGAREVDASGATIPRHRILEIAEVVDKRVVPLGGSVTDTLEVALTEGIVWPLEVRARWLFRRANPEFTAFALGKGETLPAYEVAAVHAFIEAP